MERVAIVVRLKPGTEPRAAELIAHGPPFDLSETGITGHSVYLSAGEVVFVFEGHQVEWPLEELIDERPGQLGPVFEEWRAIADGPPRMAREHFVWERGAIEDAAAQPSAAGRESWA